MRLTFYFFVLVSLIGFSCTKTYYISPMYGNSMPYHTLPLKKDSIKSALYANGSLMYGGANYNLHDEEFAGQLNLYNTNQLGLIKLWYGGGVTLGNYKVLKYDSANHPAFDTAQINNLAGNKFFGSINSNGGITITVPLDNKDEMRIGAQATLQKEFGNYLAFRNKLLSDSIYVTGINAGSILGTIGFSTEFVFKTKTGAFSIFQQYNILTGKNYKYMDPDVSLIDPQAKRYSFYSSTYALTYKETTVYFQQNLGRRMMNFQIGVNYKLFAFTKK